jgi:RpiB/LacA/LacB family sugar-phosphate isomerase
MTRSGRSRIVLTYPPAVFMLTSGGRLVRIYVGCDHAGFSLRKTVVERLRAQGKDVVDLGPESDAACDYPEFAYAVANRVRSEPGAMGILVCSTGQGMATAAGKVRGIRAALPATIEAARLSRIDNNANVLCLAGRILSEGDALAMVDTWLATSFAGGRHARRIAKVAAIETASAVAFVTESERLYLGRLGLPERLFAQDPSLFSTDPAIQAQIRNGLRFVSLPQEMIDKVPEMVAFADQVRQAGVKDAVLLFDAEDASIATLASVWGTAGLRFHFAQAGGPEPPGTIEQVVQLDSTVVLVFSRGSRMGDDLKAKEGRLWSKMVSHWQGSHESAGQHFVALTAAVDGALSQLARAHHYAKVFVESASLGGCFGALGFAGLLPAALAGLAPLRLVTRAKQMSDACRSERLEDNPGASLGVLLGAMAKHGRHKVTLLASKSLEPLVGWISQLLSTATRSHGRGIVVCSGEPLQTSYPPDRVFVHLQAADDPPAIAAEAMETLHIGGQPYIQIPVADKFEIAAEIFRWQMAAVVAALAMATNPFHEAVPGPGQPAA